MFNTGCGSVMLASSLWLGSQGARGGSIWEGMLAPVAVFAIVASAVAFLYLVQRICWGIQQFVAASRERSRTHRKIAEALHEYVEAQRLTGDQVWSASSALSPC